MLTQQSDIGHQPATENKPLTWHIELSPERHMSVQILLQGKVSGAKSFF